MIYMDMDGVTADFGAALVELGIPPRLDDVDIPRSEMTPEQLANDDRIKELMATPGFFEWLRPPPGARELWEFCSRVDPGFIVLTALPRDPRQHSRVRREKRAMIHREYGPIADGRLITCMASEKRDYVGYRPGPLQILVDDRPKLCGQWSDAGGIGIIHRDAHHSIGLISMFLRERAPDRLLVTA